MPFKPPRELQPTMTPFTTKPNNGNMQNYVSQGAYACKAQTPCFPCPIKSSHSNSRPPLMHRHHKTLQHHVSLFPICF